MTAKVPTPRPFTFREEANAVTCSAFRNGFIEELHAGAHSNFLERPGLMRVTADEMERMMSEGAARIAKLTGMKRQAPEQYWEFINEFNRPGGYVDRWDRSEPARSRRRRTAGATSRPEPVEGEARCIAEYTFGQSYVVELSEGERSDLLTRPDLSRITDVEMALIMMGTSARMAELLRLEAEDPAEYARVLHYLRGLSPKVRDY